MTEQAPIFNGWDSDDHRSYTILRTDGTEEEFEATHITYVKRAHLKDPDRFPRRVDGLVKDVEIETGPDDTEWLRVSSYPKRRWNLREALHRAHIQTWEWDLKPLRRVIAESDEVLAGPSDLRQFYFDLEVKCDVSLNDQIEGKARIIAYAWYCPETGEKGSEVLEADTDSAERAMLKNLLREMFRHHVASGWNSSMYDEPVLKGRCEKLRISVDWRRILFMDMLSVWRKAFVRGGSGEEVSSFALDDIGANVLGQRKLDMRKVLTEMGIKLPVVGPVILDAWKHAKGVLRQYNERDVDLMRLAEERKGFMRLRFQLAQLCRTFAWDWSLSPVHLADGVFCRLGSRRGIHFPDKREPTGEEQKARGAIILPITPGVYRDVHMLDFSAMYPNIIRTANISMDTRVDASWKGPKAETPNGAFYRTDIQGAFPFIVSLFTQKRMELKALAKLAKTDEEQVDAINRSDIYKVFCNSLYGIQLNKYARYYDFDNGEAVTTTARSLLAIIVSTIKKAGGEMVMGDTDGAAAIGYDPERTCRKAERICRQWAKRQGFRETDYVIEHETTFDLFCIGTKKRYVGKASYYKGAHLDEPKIEVKGYECMRGDSMAVARHVQKWMIDQFLSDSADPKVIRAHLDEVRMQLLRHEIEHDELIIRKRLKKPIKEYVSPGPHVQVAEWMTGLGFQVFIGSKIPYIVTGKEVGRQKSVHPTQFDGIYNGALTWNKLVYPALARFAEVAWPDEPWGTLVRRLNTVKPIHPGQQALGLAEPPVERRKIELPSEPVQGDAEPQKRLQLALAGKVSTFFLKHLRKLVKKHTGSVPIVLAVHVPWEGWVDVTINDTCDPESLMVALKKSRNVRCEYV